MARKRKSSAPGLFLLTLIVIAVFGFGAYYITKNYFSSPAKPPVSTTKVRISPVPVPAVEMKEVTVYLPSKVRISPVPVPAVEMKEVTVYLPENTKNGVRLVPTTRSTQAKNDILDEAVQALIEYGTDKKTGFEVIPKGTKLLMPITVKHGIATVNFSKEFTENFSGGSEEEAVTLNAIAHTLVYYKEMHVKQIRILVEGEPIDSLGGHFDLTEPLTADSTMLKADR